MTEQGSEISRQDDQTQSSEKQGPLANGYDFLSQEEVDEIVNRIPQSKVEEKLAIGAIILGKNVLEFEDIVDETNTVLIVDNDSELSEEDGILRSKEISAEIHENKTDIVVCRKGVLRVVVGRELAGKKQAQTPQGELKPGEWIGEGVKNGAIIELHEGQGMRIHAGWSHVHGTRSGEMAGATFGKIHVENPTPPMPIAA